MNTIEDKIIELVSTSDSALEHMLRTDEQAARYTLDKLSGPIRNEGEDRIFVSDVKDAKPIAEAIKAGVKPKVYFWIGFIERVGGPTEHTRLYRNKQQEIADANVGLAFSMAHKLLKNNSRWDVNELASEGYIGLRRAVELFEPSRGFKFSTYAMTWIRQHITRFLLKNASLVHMPENVVAERRKNGSFKDALSLDYTAINEEDDCSIQIESRLPPPDRSQEAKEEASRLETYLGKLDQRERQIVALRYGLNNGPTMTLAEVGDVMGISRQRVMQIEGRAIKKLKRMGEIK